MRGQVACWVVVLAVVGMAAGWAAATSVPATQGTPLVQAVPWTLNGGPAQPGAVLVGTTPLVGLRTTLGMLDPKVKIASGAGGAVTLTRDKMEVKFASFRLPDKLPPTGDKAFFQVQFQSNSPQMWVNGAPVPLATPGIVFQGTTYVPQAVLQPLFPDYQISMAFDSATKAVALTYRPKPPKPVLTSRPMPPGPRPQPAAQMGCAPTSGAQGVPTQEFGKAGAKLEITALLPITHGCHVRTEAELKRAYQLHPNDIHLTIVDLFGPDSQKYQPKVPGGMRACVGINGKNTFQYAGRTVSIEKPEGGEYQVSDIVPIIENEIQASK